jgi:hypothetical protein
MKQKFQANYIIMFKNLPIAVNYLFTIIIFFSFLLIDELKTSYIFILETEYRNTKWG